MKNRALLSFVLGVFIVLTGSGILSAVDAQVSHRFDRGACKDLDVHSTQIHLIHDAEEGYAELPSLTISPAWAYIAFDARTNGLTRLHLCRLDRTGKGDLLKTVITSEDQMTFGSSMALEEGDTIWLAWTSHADGQWLIKGCRVLDMQPSSELVISGPEGLNSQVQVESHQGVTWFVWALWENDNYRVMANTFDGQLGEAQTIYESPNPIGRPDLSVVSTDRVVFVWDEYVDNRFVVRMRERVGGRLEPVRDLSGYSRANSWGPCVCAGKNEVLTVWHGVPWGGITCRPAASTAAGILYEEGLGYPENPETWRVNCFSGSDGNTWALWLNRVKHRSTQAYMRRVGPDGVSELCRMRFQGQDKPFMNYLECACDRNLVLAWSSWGTVKLCEFEMPVLGDGELPSPEAGAAERDSIYASVRSEGDFEYSTLYEGDSLHVYFGDYHNHTSFSDGRAFPDMVMLFGRDTRRLDFICVTDHDGSLMPSEFAWNNCVADMLTEEGKYVCLHGLEISKNWTKDRFGHWNMLFPGPVTIFRYEDGMTPTDLYEVAKEHGAVLVPHHVAKRFASHDWDYHDAEAEPVVEMCSIHGVFETMVGLEERSDMVEGRFVEDGLARGYRVGFVGASDFHNPFMALTTEKGLTGVYAPVLTQGSIIEAIKKRRTFATTGSMIVVDFRCNGRFMGEHMETTGELNFAGYAESADSIHSLEIVSNKQTVFYTMADDTRASFDWRTSAPDFETYYYLRVTTPGGDLAWSSPIWITPNQ